MGIVTEGEVEESDSANHRGYGVRVRLDDGRELRLRDVDTDRPRVERFLCRLMGEVLNREQLRYLAEDLLHGEYDGTRT